jgi:hypothetical protein
MLIPDQFPYVKRKIACAAKAHAQRLVTFQIWLAGINGSLIFIIAFMLMKGDIEPHQLMIAATAAAFLIGLQVVLCWLLFTLYKLQEKIRLLSVANTVPYIPIFVEPFLTLQYSPPRPPPVFQF